RPDDPVVWRTALTLAMAADKVDQAELALGHLDASQVSPELIHRLEAWFAAHRDDTLGERGALERLIALSPGDTIALERLAVLEVQAGSPERAISLRNRKAELDRARREYSHGIRRNLVAESAAMARMAEVLGRRFEARALWTVTLNVQPTSAEARAAL